MRPVRDIAPRVTLYPCESVPPPVQAGAIALPYLPPVLGSPTIFGDGSHPTTRLCATALDLLCRQRQPAAVLDVGTGTGVLARIARARGARCIAATDIDPVAQSSARAHAALDPHPLEIHVGCEAPDHWGARFDLVVANILEMPLHELAPALCRALAPGGVLLLSGFTRLQTPALNVAYEHAGLRSEGCFTLAEWVLLRLVQQDLAV